MLTAAIGELATDQSSGSKTTIEKLAQLLNYCATHPDASVRLTASDLLIVVESDAPYLVSVVNARSCTAGYFYVTNKPTKATESFKANGTVPVLYHIMREVLSSAAEAEFGALVHNGKESCPQPVGIALEETGHPQPATPMMATNNRTASGITTDTVKQKRSKKAVDIRVYWMRDRVLQGPFQIYWCSGKQTAPIIFPNIIHPPSSGHLFYVLVLICISCKPNASGTGNLYCGPW
ncbi:Reverse transcriptase (RNA-dependent DNA polymerase) [Fragilaria crotonensis]|nr:Reverse transcriptase (RNA-dependent DNA polymerase) [Fragilaria crotonensis]